MKNEFIKFLKSKRLWAKFQREWDNYGDREGTVNSYLEYMDDYDYIHYMDYTVSEFWENINMDWNEHLKTLK